MGERENEHQNEAASLCTRCPWSGAHPCSTQAKRGMSHSYREGLGAEYVSVCVCVSTCACACLHVPVRVLIPEEDVSLASSPKPPIMIGYMSLYPTH